MTTTGVVVGWGFRPACTTVIKKACLVTTAMSGGTYTVNGTAVVCGDVQTSNATVYIIGSVLMPKSP